MKWEQRPCWVSGIYRVELSPDGWFECYIGGTHFDMALTLNDAQDACRRHERTDRKRALRAARREVQWARECGALDDN